MATPSCKIWADCTCGEGSGCGCGDSCGCGTVSHEALAAIKASACKLKDCSCGSSCGCGTTCGCGGSGEKSEEDWIAFAKAQVAQKGGDCPWSDCKCKAAGKECACKSGCGCGSVKA